MRSRTTASPEPSSSRTGVFSRTVWTIALNSPFVLAMLIPGGADPLRRLALPASPGPDLVTFEHQGSGLCCAIVFRTQRNAQHRVIVELELDRIVRRVRCDHGSPNQRDHRACIRFAKGDRLSLWTDRHLGSRVCRKARAIEPQLNVVAHELHRRKVAAN